VCVGFPRRTNQGDRALPSLKKLEALSWARNAGRSIRPYVNQWLVHVLMGQRISKELSLELESFPCSTVLRFCNRQIKDWSIFAIRLVGLGTDKTQRCPFQTYLTPPQRLQHRVLTAPEEDDYVHAPQLLRRHVASFSLRRRTAMSLLLLRPFSSSSPWWRISPFAIVFFLTKAVTRESSRPGLLAAAIGRRRPTVARRWTGGGRGGAAGIGGGGQERSARVEDWWQAPRRRTSRAKSGPASRGGWASSGLPAWPVAVGGGGVLAAASEGASNQDDPPRNASEAVELHKDFLVSSELGRPAGPDLGCAPVQIFSLRPPPQWRDHPLDPWN
jgi:hypothetical protein